MKAVRHLKPLSAPERHPVERPYRIERSERCIHCGTCIDACLYGCHERSRQDPREMADPQSSCCRNCFACVFQCPRQALTMIPNPAYLRQGDTTHKPSYILSILDQAATGKIPVSGCGYGGPFDGVDYDNIWTDMSEIVRPTRDGIHGREHICTAVSLGRMLPDICDMEFDAAGHLTSLIPPNREIPIPVLFAEVPWLKDKGITKTLAMAASKLTTYLTVGAEDNPEHLMEYFNHLIVRMKPNEVDRYRSILEWATFVEFEPDGDPIGAIAKARRINPHLLTICRVPARHEVEKDILELAQDGAETLHLSADTGGRGRDGVDLLSCLSASHGLLVESGLRDQVTLLASGGIIAAEHVPKTIILGADAVFVNTPLLIALECNLCGECWEGRECPRGIDEADPQWGATRIINLILCWRDQLLEVLGAMGLSDVRRLRGERGRAIFADRARIEFCDSLSRGSASVPESSAAASTSMPSARESNRLRRLKGSEAPSRFSVKPGRYRVHVDPIRCTHCGMCIATCRFGAHRMVDGRHSLDEPHHDRCIGTDCLENDWCCVHVCPWEAIRVELDPIHQVLGDDRWTGTLLMETWRQAQSGTAPQLHPSAQRGRSKGGFDTIEFVEPTSATCQETPIDLSIPLNRRSEGPRIDIPVPMYGGGMSYGSVSLVVMMGRAMAAQQLGTFTCTGEGGYPEALIPFAPHVITQIATGLFGVREETIARARLVEFKYAQGAKPGLGGHLLGEKNTPQVAAMREAVPGTSLFSPFPFHSVYSVEDHKKHVDWVRAIHPEVLVSVKVSTPRDVDMVAVGSYYAGANIIHLDGAYGGTGAAPDIAKKNIAQPIEYATVQVHDFLLREGIRDQVTLIVSGGIRTADDVLKAVCLGADGVVLGTAELVAIDCVRCRNCERERGCPIGIATTDPILSQQLDPHWVRDRIVNLYSSWSEHMRRRLGEFGFSRIGQLVGRRDLLRHISPPAGQTGGVQDLQGNP